MMELYRNSGFIFGFLLGVFIFTSVNLIPNYHPPKPPGAFSPSHEYDDDIRPGDTEYGFPFDGIRHRPSMFSPSDPWVMKPVMIVNVLLGIVFCFVVGLCAKTIADAFADYDKIRKIKAEARKAE